MRHLANVVIIKLLLWSKGYGSTELPNVKLVGCPEVSMVGFDKCLVIKFSNLEEYAGLNEADGSSEILVGKLYGTDGACNDDSRVSVSIDGGFYFVMIHDPSDEELYKLKVDISTGVAKRNNLSPNVELDDEIIPEETRAFPSVPAERQSALPASGFRMKVLPMLDLSWRNQFGGQAETRLNAVIEHAKTFFQHSSLVTRYELEMLPVHNYPSNLKATSNQLYTLRNYVATGGGVSLPLANSYALLAMRDSSGAAGIAFVGTACSSSRGLRTSINEYYGDIPTAEILVHEIGHNLNMRHDFLAIQNGRKTPRFSSNGAACTDIGGYMDYFISKNKWSTCSVEDITKYYNQIGPSTYGTICMSALQDMSLIKVKRACENYDGSKNLVLQCPSGSAIKVVSANYGRTNTGYCQKYSWSKVNCASKQPDTNNKVRSECDNKQQCSISASNGAFGDPCFGIYKYLEVWYTCKQITLKVVRGCQIYNGSKNLALECPRGSAINVVSANYGRTSYSYCPKLFSWPRKNFASKQPDTDDKVRSTCNNKQQCNVSVSNTVFGNPCFGTHKYLEVWYFCK